MDANSFRVVLQIATATVNLAILGVPLNAPSRQYMLNALEDHVNRIYELADRINAEFRVQEVDLAGDAEGSQSSSDVFEVAVSDQSSEEGGAKSGNEVSGDGMNGIASPTGTVVGSDSPTYDELIVSNESQIEPVATSVNRFFFENYDDTDDEEDQKELESNISIKQESPQYDMASLKNQGTDNEAERKNGNEIVEDGATVEGQMTTRADLGKMSSPKRKRAAADSSSDNNADDEASETPKITSRKRSRGSGWTPINIVYPPVDAEEESDMSTRSNTPPQEHHPIDPSIVVIDFGTAVEDASVLRRSSRSNRGRRRANSIDDPQLRRTRDAELVRTERERQERVRSARQGSKG